MPDGQGWDYPDRITLSTIEAWGLSLSETTPSRDPFELANIEHPSMRDVGILTQKTRGRSLYALIYPSPEYANEAQKILEWKIQDEGWNVIKHAVIGRAVVFASKPHAGIFDPNDLPFEVRAPIRYLTAYGRYPIFRDFSDHIEPVSPTNKIVGVYVMVGRQPYSSNIPA